jgi:oxygen-independent coproporphyrinogen III oxidase
MPGIYIHIPFCKQACHYCDFHFSTSLKNKEDFLLALKKEILLQKDYLSPAAPSSKPVIQSIYFGGGTPSLLSEKDILGIFDTLNLYFAIEKNAEITLEANPDDLTEEKIRELKNTPVNRLSIGIQSFSDTELKLLNRAHNSSEAVASVRYAQKAGFDNITIDLIYGIQTLTNEQWEKNLDTAFSLEVPHISAYCLTVEPKTALSAFIKKGKLKNVDEEKSERNNFIQYEISNFCKVNYYSRHNSSYWKNEPYLGLGPSAHSYNGSSRQWNIANNNIYIKSLENNELTFEKEVLTKEIKHNEYILTSLRTTWGCDTAYVKKGFGEEYLRHLLKRAEPYISQNCLSENGGILTLTNSGKFIADRIASDLFI